jgi:hypothetical protein
MHIHFDIETIPSQSDDVREALTADITPPGNISKPETIAAWNRDKRPAEAEKAWRKTALDGLLGHVAVIGAAFNDEEPVSFHVADALGGPEVAAGEAQVLRGFFDWLRDRTSGQRAIFVGHNIVNFDLLFLWQRCIVLGVPAHRSMPLNARPYDERIFDTMRAWTAGDRTRFVSLDNLAQACGLKGKTEGMDGSQVWDYVNAGRIGEVADYCKDDVRATREIHRRMQSVAALSIA